MGLQRVVGLAAWSLCVQGGPPPPGISAFLGVSGDNRPQFSTYSAEPGRGSKTGHVYMDL